MSAVPAVRSAVLARTIAVYRRLVGQRTPRRYVGVTKRLLLDQGYVRSVRTGAPVDHDGAPLPWYTYPAIEWLSGLDFADRRVFEFGGGNSTRYWERRAASVTTVETDPEWYERILPQLDPATTMVLCHDREQYLGEIDRHQPFDVIVVDGLWRKPSARKALDALAPGGMVILDNADWFPYSHRLLRDAGLIPIDFHGAGPIARYSWTTTVFLHRDADFWSGTDGPRPIGGVRPPEMFAIDAEDDAGTAPGS